MFIDIAGERFDQLLAVRYEPDPKSGRRLWYCECSCGGTRYVDGHALRHGRYRSCGHVRRSMTIARSTVHGQSRTPLYALWKRLRIKKITAETFLDWSRSQKEAVRLHEVSEIESSRTSEGRNDNSFYYTAKG